MGQERVSGRASRVTQAAAVLSLAILVVVLSSARAIELTSFRTSYSRVTTSDVGFYSGSSLLSSIVSDTPYSYSEFGVSPSWHWFTKTESDPRDWSLSQWLRLGWHGSQGAWPSAHRTDGFLYITEEVDLNWQQYLGRSDFLVCLAPSVGLHPYARFDSGLAEVGLHGSGDVKLGIGYGRFRDAWPLAKAIRLVSILRDCNLLESEPREGPLLKLADFISSSWRLFYAHDRAAKFYYDSLEVILLEARVLKQPLPAYVLMKLDDALTVGSDTREFGSRVLIGSSGSFLGSYEYTPARGQTPADSHGFLRRSIAFPYIEYRYARPIGLRWVTGADFRYDLAPAADTPIHTANVKASGSYQLTNRLLVGVSFAAKSVGRHALGTFANPTVSLASGISGNFQYYLTDQLSVKVSVGVSDERSLVGNPVASSKSRVFFGCSVGAGPQWSGEQSPVFEP